MGDKKPSKSVEGVTATLESCGLKTDQSSKNISANLIADNLSNGARGVGEITSGARIPASVGQCVADQYDGKKTDLSSAASAFLNMFKSAATNVAASTEAAMKASEPTVNAGVTERGATLDQFCATVDANGGSARDMNIAMQKCNGPKARTP